MLVWCFHVGLLLAVAAGYYLLWKFDCSYPWLLPGKET